MSVRLTGRTRVDLGIHSLLSLIGLVGLATSFHSLGWLSAGVGGLAVGTGAALFARRLRLGALLSTGLALIGYLVFGSAFAVPSHALGLVIPTPTSIADLGVGAVWGWADLVTLRPPVQLPDYVTVVPYVGAWLVGTVGATLATRWLPRRRTAPRAAVLLIGPAMLYVAGILLGTEQAYFPVLRGVVFAIVSLVWLGWRPGAAELSFSRVRGVLVVVGAAAAIGAMTSAAVAPPAASRFVLRDQIQPPFHALQFSSPLAGFRQYSKLAADTTLFVVTGLTTDQRLRLATMDSFDGHLWTVAGSAVATDGSGSFALVGSDYPAPPLVTSARTQTISMTIATYADVWIPTLGYPTAVGLPTTSDERLTGMRYNATTGSAVLLGGLSVGDTLTETARVQKTDYDDASLRDVPTARMQEGPAEDIPDIVAAKATEFAGETTSPIDQLRSIEQTLHTTGFLSHGSASDTVFSPAGHGADRMESLLSGSVMVGDAEQYASAMALMARSLGYPSRVVMGFAPTVSDAAARRHTPVKVTGRDVTAWVEVPFQRVGWIPFLPTPTQTDVPQDQVPKPQTQPQPQVRQPPRSLNDENDLVTNVSIDNSKKKKSDSAELPSWLVPTSLGVGIPSVMIVVPFVVIAVLKGRRTRRRRGARRLSDAAAGAWLELLDRLVELGIPSPPPSTRARTAQAIAPQLDVGIGASSIMTLAFRTDEAVFSGRELEQKEIDEVWNEVIATVEATRATLPRWRRVLVSYRLAALTAWSRRAAGVASVPAPGGGLPSRSEEETATLGQHPNVRRPR